MSLGKVTAEGNSNPYRVQLEEKYKTMYAKNNDTKPIGQPITTWVELVDQFEQQVEDNNI